MRVIISVDQGAMDALRQQVSNETATRAAKVTRDRAKANLAAAGRINTAALWHSIHYRQIRSLPKGSAYMVGSTLPYAIFQEEGIGPVHARPGGVLRFRPVGQQGFIFRPRTKGFKGAFYLRHALDALTERDFE